MSSCIMGGCCHIKFHELLTYKIGPTKNAIYLTHCLLCSPCSALILDQESEKNDTVGKSTATARLTRVV
jgi:hypothetical protein